jgi:hypothetical protein
VKDERSHGSISTVSVLSLTAAAAAEGEALFALCFGM